MLGSRAGPSSELLNMFLKNMLTNSILANDFTTYFWLKTLYRCTKQKMILVLYLSYTAQEEKVGNIPEPFTSMGGESVGLSVVYDFLQSHGL